MHSSLRMSTVAVAVAVGLAMIAALVGFETSAHAGTGGSQALVMSSSLAPSQPTMPDIFGVKAGGLPWSLGHAHARLGQGGALQVNVTGLVVTTSGTNPVPDLAASVFCNGTLAATTAPVPFSPAGNARIHAMLSLPALCPAPAILLNPSLGASSTDVVTGLYIGFDGTA